MVPHVPPYISGSEMLKWFANGVLGSSASTCTEYQGAPEHWHMWRVAQHQAQCQAPTTSQARWRIRKESCKWGRQEGKMSQLGSGKRLATYMVCWWGPWSDLQGAHSSRCTLWEILSYSQGLILPCILRNIWKYHTSVVLEERQDANPSNESWTGWTSESLWTISEPSGMKLLHGFNKPPALLEPLLSVSPLNEWLVVIKGENSAAKA